MVIHQIYTKNIYLHVPAAAVLAAGLAVLAAAVLAALDWVATYVDRITGRRTVRHQLLKVLDGGTVVVAATVLAVLTGLERVATYVDRITGRRTGVHQLLKILSLATENVDVVV